MRKTFDATVKPVASRNKKKFDAAKRDDVKMGGDVKGKDGRVVDKNRERKEGGSTDKRGGRGRSSSRGSSRGGRGGGREGGPKGGPGNGDVRKGNRNSSHVHRRPTK